MDREAEVLKYVNTSEIGIEVAPYFRPILPKAKHPKTLTLDVFDAETLRKQAREDGLLSEDDVTKIEDVDIVSDAGNIGDVVANAGLAEKIEYIISSHNMEHLPNPIRFLQGCSSILAPGGVIALIVPDCRACFDHFRYPTRLSDWLIAWKEGRSKPSAEQVFDNFWVHSRYRTNGRLDVGCSFGHDDPSNFELSGSLETAYAYFERALDPDVEYLDAHCSVFFPETLELMLRDLNSLGIIDLEILEVSKTYGLEFFVHLRKPDGSETATKDSPETRNAKRSELLVSISRKIGRSAMTAEYKSRSAPLSAGEVPTPDTATSVEEPDLVGDRRGAPRRGSKGKRGETALKNALSRAIGQDKSRKRESWWLKKVLRRS